MFASTIFRGIYQSFEHWISKEIKPWKGLTVEQQEKIAETLESDLTASVARRTFIQEIKTDSRIVLLVHRILCSDKSERYLELKKELKQEIFDDLEIAMQTGQALQIEQWLKHYETYFDAQTISSLEAYEQLCLADALNQVSAADSGMYQNLSDQMSDACHLVNTLPKLTLEDFERYHNDFDQSLSNLCQAIKTDPSEKNYAILAYYVSQRRISITALIKKLDEEHLLHLASYLRFGHFSSVESALTLKMLEKASKLKELEIIGDKDMQSLPKGLTALQKLCCLNCNLESLADDMHVLQRIDIVNCPKLS